MRVEKSFENYSIKRNEMEFSKSGKVFMKPMCSTEINYMAQVMFITSRLFMSELGFRSEADSSPTHLFKYICWEIAMGYHYAMGKH